MSSSIIMTAYYCTTLTVIINEVLVSGCNTKNKIAHAEILSSGEPSCPRMVHVNKYFEVTYKITELQLPKLVTQTNNAPSSARI